jgi:hypothetical protein
VFALVTPKSPIDRGMCMCISAHTSIVTALPCGQLFIYMTWREGLYLLLLLVASADGILIRIRMRSNMVLRHGGKENPALLDWSMQGRLFKTHGNCTVAILSDQALSTYPCTLRPVSLQSANSWTTRNVRKVCSCIYCLEE